MVQRIWSIASILSSEEIATSIQSFDKNKPQFYLVEASLIGK